VAIGSGFVEGHRLTFDKVSNDGSGKCNVEPTSDPGERVSSKPLAQRPLRQRLT
jgi:hypothetical protein